jgi:hypothetical protein
LWSTPELPAVADVGEDVQQVARLGRADARAVTGERPESAAGQPDRAGEEREVGRGRGLADAPRRLVDDGHGDASGGDLAGCVERRSEDVAPVHHRTLEPDRAHQTVDQVPAAARRPAERHEQSVRRLVVRRVEHPPEQAVDVASRSGRAVDP